MTRQEEKMEAREHKLLLGEARKHIMDDGIMLKTDMQNIVDCLLFLLERIDYDE